ncbi:transmembrane protein, putative [Actinidia rufa]|uniref:Transmembrane protein, putative n=1 Tax=Actinidia rufa TaxID=165716 RepID=A0A7J0FXE3_9ERIC|nr:transmembrane protein, putative [Actinidia rufa]
MNTQNKQKHGGGGGRGKICVKVAMGVMGLCLGGYIVGPPLYWHISEPISSLRRSSCPPCLCDCSSHPLLSLPQDCTKHDPEVSVDLDKSFMDLTSEEMKLMEAEALENQRRADMAFLEAKKMASQYQKEADKCNFGMETCEEAREKAEASLEAQRELSAMWELKARQKGWKDGPVKSRLRL